MNANVPWVAIIPGTILILYGIICMVKGKKSFDEVAIGICLLLVPVIIICAVFLICGIVMSWNKEMMEKESFDCVRG